MRRPQTAVAICCLCLELRLLVHNSFCCIWLWHGQAGKIFIRNVLVTAPAPVYKACRPLRRLLAMRTATDEYTWGAVGGASCTQPQFRVSVFTMDRVFPGHIVLWNGGRRLQHQSSPVWRAAFRHLAGASPSRSARHRQAPSALSGSLQLACCSGDWQTAAQPGAASPLP